MVSEMSSVFAHRPREDCPSHLRAEEEPADSAGTLCYRVHPKPRTELQRNSPKPHELASSLGIPQQPLLQAAMPSPAQASKLIEDAEEVFFFSHLFRPRDPRLGPGFSGGERACVKCSEVDLCLVSALAA